MAELKYQGFSAEYTADGGSSSYVYRGTRREMEELAARHRIDEAEAAGRLRSIRVAPRDGTVWECELRYEAPDDWQSITSPDRAWGKRSCQLRGSMFSRPLAAHPRYRVNWDHALAAVNGVSQVPGWWESAKDTAIPAADREKYRWCKSSGELPGSGAWGVLKAPVKPGVTSFTDAAYTIVETARFRSASAAGGMVSRSLNRIGSPTTKFGIAGGEWKCDDAEVSWNGRYWLARLSWTRSENGWDRDLYGAN